MRFWPFGKRQRAETHDAPPATPAAVAPTRERPPTGAWRRLPALRPTSASLEMTAPVQRLTGTLTSTQRTQVSARELSHARPLAGPTGSVAGLVRPHRTVDRDGAASPLTFAHAPEPIEATEAVPIRPWDSVQRLPTSPAGSRSVPTTSGGSSITASSNVAPSITAPSVPGPDESAAPPVPTMPTPAARRMPARSLPAAAAVEVAEVPPTSPIATPIAAPVVQRLPEPGPELVEPSSARGSSTGAPAAVERSIVEASAPTRADAPTLGSTRIVRRVGAPMHSRPASMVDAVPSEPEPVQALPVATSEVATGDQAPTPPPAVRNVSSQVPGSLPDLPARPMQPSISAGSGATGTTGGPIPAPRPKTTSDAPLVGRAPSMQRLPGTAPAMTIPKLVSPEPASESAPDVVPARRGVQRAPESVPPTVRSELEPVLGDSLSDVKVHRGPETGAAARSIQAKAFTTGGAVYMPDEHGPTESGEGRKILAHELTHVVQQRSLGGSLPSEDSTEGARLEHEARVVGGQSPVPTRPVASTPAMGRPAAAGRPQRLAGSPMPTPSWSLPAVSGEMGAAPSFEGSPLPPSSPAAIAATVQAAATRAGVPSSPAAAATSSQSALSPGGGTTPRASSPPAGAVQRLSDEAATASTSSSTESSSASSRTSNVSAPESGGPTDLDDLERQLYPRIRTRLRRDLLADRERSGRLFDR